jgi:hypothetical protein
LARHCWNTNNDDNNNATVKVDIQATDLTLTVAVIAHTPTSKTTEPDADSTEHGATRRKMRNPNSEPMKRHVRVRHISSSTTVPAGVNTRDRQ